MEKEALGETEFNLTGREAELQQNFRLDLDDEDAIHFLQGLINESISAFFPQVVETIHQWAQSRQHITRLSRL
uniref:Uncharacterized protein n=1 Tax=Oryza nivara TaxID=4536 RepID=A0A0E0IA20_ORYNI